VGICFIALAVYITPEALYLITKTAPEHSLRGIILACVSLVVMPLLSRDRRKVGRAMGRWVAQLCTRKPDKLEFGMYLSAILLGGLLVRRKPTSTRQTP
jgi:hypothetical protein